MRTEETSMKASRHIAVGMLLALAVAAAMSLAQLQNRARAEPDQCRDIRRGNETDCVSGAGAAGDAGRCGPREGAVSVRGPAEDAMVELSFRHLSARGVAPRRPDADPARRRHDAADNSAQPTGLPEGRPTIMRGDEVLRQGERAERPRRRSTRRASGGPGGGAELRRRTSTTWRSSARRRRPNPGCCSSAATTSRST